MAFAGVDLFRVRHMIQLIRHRRHRFRVEEPPPGIHEIMGRDWAAIAPERRDCRRSGSLSASEFNWQSIGIRKSYPAWSRVSTEIEGEPILLGRCLEMRS